MISSSHGFKDCASPSLMSLQFEDTVGVVSLEQRKDVTVQ